MIEDCGESVLGAIFCEVFDVDRREVLQRISASIQGIKCGPQEVTAQIREGSSLRLPIRCQGGQPLGVRAGLHIGTALDAAQYNRYASSKSSWYARFGSYCKMESARAARTPGGWSTADHWTHRASGPIVAAQSVPGTVFDSTSGARKMSQAFGCTPVTPGFRVDGLGVVSSRCNAPLLGRLNTRRYPSGEEVVGALAGG
jgi:hypothetical protein